MIERSRRIVDERDKLKEAISKAKWLEAARCAGKIEAIANFGDLKKGGKEAIQKEADRLFETIYKRDKQRCATYFNTLDHLLVKHFRIQPNSFE